MSESKAAVEFKVTRASKASDKQKEVGIFGTFTLAIIVNSTIVATLHDYKLCKSRDGNWYIQAPYRSFEAQNRDTGVMEKRKLQYYKLFPEREDWSKQEPVIAMVRNDIERARPRSDGAAPAPAPAPSAPASADDIF